MQHDWHASLFWFDYGPERYHMALVVTIIVYWLASQDAFGLVLAPFHYHTHPNASRTVTVQTKYQARRSRACRLVPLPDCAQRFAEILTSILRVFGLLVYMYKFRLSLISHSCLVAGSG